jgi:DNA-directed RNA polymerase specialized sigma24 family protein
VTPETASRARVCCPCAAHIPRWSGELKVAATRVHPDVATFVATRARLLRCRTGQSPTDDPDLVQEMLTRLVAQGHDLANPRWPMLRRSVRCIAANIVRHRCAKKRDCRRTRSFANQAIEGVLTDRDMRQAADLAVDLAAVIDRLPSDLKTLARLLLERSLNDSEAGRVLGVPRTTVAYRRSMLRRWFEQAGLDCYL